MTTVFDTLLRWDSTWKTLAMDRKHAEAVASAILDRPGRACHQIRHCGAKSRASTAASTACKAASAVCNGLSASIIAISLATLAAVLAMAFRA